MRAWFIGLGALAGAVTGLLVAPQSGREFRSAVRRRVGAGGKAVQGTPAEPRVRAVFNRAEELPQR
jgi:gas vesicle protein